MRGSTLYYVLKDHLGSASVVTETTGTIVGEDRFYPFGETRFTTGAMNTDRLFTGQREITGLGIYDYGARFYSPKLGRFLSPDTIVPGYANPQNLNRFAYGLNNPSRYTDPTGHRICDYDCQIEYEGADPAYKHYCESCEWNVAKQRKNEKIAEKILDSTTKLGLWTVAPPVRLFYQTINNEHVSGVDVAFAALPLGEASGLGDEIIGRTVGHHTIPRQIIKMLPEDISMAVRGKRGAPIFGKFQKICIRLFTVVLAMEESIMRCGGWLWMIYRSLVTSLQMQSLRSGTN